MEVLENSWKNLEAMEEVKGEVGSSHWMELSGVQSSEEDSRGAQLQDNGV